MLTSTPIARGLKLGEQGGTTFYAPDGRLKSRREDLGMWRRPEHVGGFEFFLCNRETTARHVQQSRPWSPLAGGKDFNPQAVQRTVDGIRNDAGAVRSAYSSIRGPDNPLERGR
jgi:hypothetical protein